MHSNISNYDVLRNSKILKKKKSGKLHACFNCAFTLLEKQIMSVMVSSARSIRVKGKASKAGGQAGGRRITGGVNTIALISPELQAAIEAA